MKTSFLLLSLILLNNAYLYSAPNSNLKNGSEQATYVNQFKGILDDEYQGVIRQIQNHIRTEFARQSLKDYGLLTCLNKIDNNESALKTDIIKLLSSYGFGGNGKYTISQNEDTFETLYDPYKVVSDAFKQNQTVSNGTIDETSSAACLQIYHSPEYAELIIDQDPYMDDLFW